MIDPSAILSFLSPSRFGINPLDIFIIVIVLFYAYEGYLLGFTLAFLDLVSFILSFIIALKFYSVVGGFLVNAFSIPIGFANAGGFFLLAFLTEITLSFLFRNILNRIPELHLSYWFSHMFKKIDNFLGIIPGVISAFIIISFLLTVIVSLPSSPFIKKTVTESEIGSRLVANTSLFENQLNKIFGGALNDTLNFLTVEPKTNELVTLHFKVANGTVSEEAEREMWRMVNTERIKVGLPPLAFDNQLRDVARAHSQDMFTRGYFSHYTPEGLSPFDRMDNAGIQYLTAGENLALAPSTKLAMQGLMNSPGHRANILHPEFGKIGIGAIDGGIYGIMFSQEFSN